jgi:hypothetical protein
MKNLENVFVYYPYNTEVIGAYGDEIIIKADLTNLDTNEDDLFVNVIIKIQTYLEMIREFISEKQDYCERYEEICGWSNISGEGPITKRELLGEECYDCTGIEFSVDMEHG